MEAVDHSLEQVEVEVEVYVNVDLEEMEDLELQGVFWLRYLEDSTRP